MDRKRNIAQINSKYSVSSHQVASNAVTPLPTLVGGTTTAIKRSRIATSTIGANQIIGGRVINSTIQNPALGSHGLLGQKLRTSFVGGQTIGRTGVSGGISTLRTSKIVTPPVYETVTHPPVYETVTTPTKVYEIVTPIIDVTPGVSTLETTKIGGQGRLWSRKDRQNGCPWWCLLLLCLLLSLFLIGGLIYLYKNFFANNKQQIVQPIVQPISPIVTKQPIQQPEPDTTKQQEPTPVPTKQPEPQPQPQPQPEPEPKPEPQSLPKQQQKQEQKKQQQHVPVKTPTCGQGTLLYNGRCLKCPAESTWNGSNCIKRVITKTKTVQYKSEGQQSGDNEIGSQSEQTKSESNSSSEQSKKTQNESQQKSEQKQNNQNKQTSETQKEQSKSSEEKQHKHIKTH